MELQTVKVPADVEVKEDGKPFFFEGSGDVGCLVIHGFTGTTMSVKPLAEFLAAKGLTALGPRLPGHGTSTSDMGRWTYTDWTSAVEAGLEELRSMCRQVFVTGLSMGGCLSLYLGERYNDAIAGIVPIAAPVYMKHPAFPLVPVLKLVMKTFPGPGNDIKDPDAEEVAYEKLSVAALHELLKLMKVVKGDLGKITVPIKIIQARDDHTVAPDNAPYIYEHVGSKDKEIVWLDNSYHVVTLDYDKEKVYEETYGLIAKVSG